MENSIDHDVIIIGAGPSGLALGHWLQKSHIDALILDKASTCGSSWRQMPDQLHLISMWPTNVLVTEDQKLFPPKMTHKAGAFADYLEEFSRKHQLKINFNTEVTDFYKNNNGFTVKTREREYKAGIVVDCRGYFNFPYTPPFKTEGSLPLMMHFKDYKNAGQFSKYKKILVVGKRLSAGQVLDELHSTGKHELFLSARSEIKFSSHPAIYNFFLSHLDAIENVIKKIKPKMKEEIEVPMHHKVKTIVKNNVVVTGEISEIKNKTVTFKDGSSLDMDAIIFTTGFRPPFVKLKNDFESVDTENLFYLGRGAQRSFTSRFIRGIRDDAPVLAKLISGRIALRNNRQ